MNIPLPDALKSFVDDQVRQRGYSANTLTRQRGDLLNALRTSIAILTSGVFAEAAGRFMPVLAFPVGWTVREFTLSKLPTYHAGDVIVSLDAKVSGGIGPQHSVSSMIIKNQGG